MFDKEEMKSCIEGWMEQAEDIEDLVRIYTTIILETEKQLAIMSNQIELQIAEDAFKKNYFEKIENGSPKAEARK